MERIKIYPEKVMHTAESVRNARNFLGIVDKIKKDDSVILNLEQPWGILSLEVDKQVKQVWRGWIYGRVRELKKDGFSELITDILKTP